MDDKFSFWVFFFGNTFSLYINVRQMFTKHDQVVLYFYYIGDLSIEAAFVLC